MLILICVPTEILLAWVFKQSAGVVEWDKEETSYLIFATAVSRIANNTNRTEVEGSSEQC
jgi:hypothetical protein